MPFVKFEDICKSVEDLLKKDFHEKKKDTPAFQLEVKSDVPVKGTKMTTKASLQKFETDKAFSSSVTLEWTGPAGFKLDKFEFSPSSSAAFTTECSVVLDAVPELKLEFKGNNVDQNDVSFCYAHERATVTGNVDASDFKNFSATVSTGVDDVVVGASAKIASGEDAKIDVSASYTAPKLFFGLNVTENFKSFKGLFSFAVDNTITVAATPSYSLNKSAFALNLGAVYKCNANTTIKTKFDLNKNFDLSVKQAINTGLSATGWATVADGNAKSANYGVKFILG